MSETIVPSSLGRIQPSLNLRVSSVSILQLFPNPTSQILCLNQIEFGLTSLEMVPFIDRFLVKRLELGEWGLVQAQGEVEALRIVVATSVFNG
jgi:hypothetical protein